MSRWLVRAAVSLVVAIVLFRIVPIRAVADALRHVRVTVWLASLVVFVAGHYLNALKLRLLLGADRQIMPACVRAQYAGLVANLGLPGIAGGDVARAAYLAPLVGTGRVVVASLSDRVLDSVNLLVIAALALPIAGLPPALQRLMPGARAAVAGGAGVLLAALALVFVVQRTAIGERVRRAVGGLMERRAALAGAVVISLGVQSAFVLTNVWLARSVGVGTPLAPWFVAWPLSKLIAVLPVSLGGIGVREAALVSLLSPYGAPREGVLATGVLWQAVLTVSGLGGLVVTQLLGTRAARLASQAELP